MKSQRTLPPAATVVTLKKLYHGFRGIFSGEKYKIRLAEEIRSYFNVKYMFPVSSGKAALYLILKALKALAPAKSGVIVPAYTCFSVPSAIVKAGLKVIPCDIVPETFDFDHDLLEKTIDKDTLCVVSTHLFGIPADIERVSSLCRDKGIFVIEDAAQAMGGWFDGKLIGTIGDAGFYSLGRGKNITCGSGGIIVTNSDAIAKKIKEEWLSLEESGVREGMKELFMMFVLYIFSNPLLYWFPSGLPFLRLGDTVFYREFEVKKLSGVKAGFLRHWQEELELSNEIRRKNGEYLTGQLQTGGDSNVNYLRFPVLMEDKIAKSKISSFSKARGMGISPMYPTPINEIEEIKEQFNGKLFAPSKQLSERLITIPTHHLVSKQDLQKASDLIRSMN